MEVNLSAAAPSQSSSNVSMPSFNRRRCRWQSFDRYSVDKDDNGDPSLMLNVFAQTLKLHLAELFTMYPCLKLLTGDAIFAQCPLLEAIQE